MNLTQISSTFLLSTHPILDKAHRIKLLLVALLLFIRDGFCMSRSASRPSLQCEQWWDNCSSEPSRSWLNMHAIAISSPTVNKQLRLSCNWWSLQHHLSTIHDGLECDWALMRGKKIKNKMNLRWTLTFISCLLRTPLRAQRPTKQETVTATKASVTLLLHSTSKCTGSALLQKKHKGFCYE